MKPPNEEKKQEELKNNNGQRKLDKALKLLDEEYIGNEQNFYEYLCNKYKINIQLIEKEPLLNTNCLSLLNEIYYDEQNIECYECKKLKNISEFDEKEITNNGYYVACKECSPERGMIINCKWSDKLKTNALILENDRHIAKINSSVHHYVIVDGNPVRNGIHLWRWYARSVSSWCLYGVSPPKVFPDQSYSSQGLFGITGSDSAYLNGAHQAGLQTSKFYAKNDNYIDMLLDVNKLEVKYNLVGENHEVKINIIANQEGWLPHMDCYYSGTNVQIKKIPVSCYGKDPNKFKFL